MQKELDFTLKVVHIDRAMNYETLHEVLAATEKNANDQGLAIKIPMITGGISYGQVARYSFEARNAKRPNSKKAWQCIVTRMDDGTYELVNYYL
tara:strand:+ start:11312 stop:11593 length:282 start_codon:yes stop_codon:yes gene_type:complete